MTENAKHSSKSSTHMTPKYIVEPARETLGVIDLDPASCEEANEVVRALSFCTEEEDGLNQSSWEYEVDCSSRVFLNPPGGNFRKARTIGDPGRYGYTKSSQVLWWLKLMIEYERGNVDSAIFVGFSVEFLQSAQQLKCFKPTDFPMCIPKKRIPFDSWVDGERVAGKQPSHANVIVFVPNAHADVERFKKAFQPIGEVFNVHV